MIWPDDFIDKVICGDCLEVMKHIPDGAVDLVVTSPPYNMRTRIRNGQYTERERSEHFSKKYSEFHDALPVQEYYQFHSACLTEMLRISKTVFWNIQIVTGCKWAALKILGDFADQIRDVIIWDKGNGEPAMHESVLNRQFEMIIVFEPGDVSGRVFRNSNFERGTMGDVWDLGRGENLPGHAACFPLSLPTRAIRYWSDNKSTILDPFAGSGTTLVAAKQLGRHYIGIEINQKYVDICNERMRQTELFPAQSLTKKVANTQGGML